MIEADDIKSALCAELPARYHDQATLLAQALAEMINADLEPEAVTARLANEPGLKALLKVMAGRSVPAGSTLVSFGTGNSFNRVTIGNIAGGDQINIVLKLPPPPSLAKQMRNRQAMLRKVRAERIDAWMAHLPNDKPSIALTLQERPDLVTSPLHSQVQELARSPRPLPSDTSLTSLFEEQGGVLLLGAAGAGKTTLLVELARDLLDQAEYDECQPIPVIFNLSSWAGRRLPLADWLVAELDAKYGVSRQLGRAWIADAQIVPLLDGFDEVPRAQRIAAIAAINAFRRDHGLISLAVCSRSDAYLDSESKLHLPTAVVVEPLTPAQIKDFLIQAGPDLARLDTLLEHDIVLRDLVTVPLMLNIAAVVYADPACSLTEAGGVAVERRAHLLKAYVAKVFRRSRVETRYTPQQTIRWLVALARLMERHDSHFFIEQLQPAWLFAWWQRLGYNMGVLFTAAGLWMVVWAGVFGLTLREIFEVELSRIVGHELGFASALFLTSVGGATVGLSLGLTWWLFAVIGSWAGGAVAALRRRSRRPDLPWMQAALLWRGLAGLAGGACGAALGFGAGWLFSNTLESLGWVTLIGLTGGATSCVFALRGLGIVSADEIRWSFRLVVVGLLFGLLMTAVTVAVGQVVIGAAGSVVSGIAPALSLALGIVFAALLGGKTSERIETRRVPNQGIRRSLRTGAIVGLVLLLAIWPAPLVSVGVTLWVNGLAPVDVLAVLSNPLIQRFGLWMGLLFGLIGGLAFGGLTVIQHGVVRLLLWMSGAIPWNYARFLDYAAERTVLFSIGGGYLFIHPLIREYFAAAEPAALFQALDSPASTSD